MGTWGTSLYSDDFAADLRAAVASVARLPLEPPQLVDAVREVEPRAADDERDEDHTTFWLVLADQLAKRGIYPEEVRRRALFIIDAGTHLREMKDRGADDAFLKKRTAALSKIRATLLAPAEKRRKGLGRPQPLLLEAGDVYALPTSDGRVINPYFSSPDQQPGWKLDGWRAFVVVETGRAFGFLAWYRPLVLERTLSSPSLPSLFESGRWELRNPGTASKQHLQRLRLQPLAKVAIDPDALARFVPDLPPARDFAVTDSSIADDLDYIGRQFSETREAQRTFITRLADVARSQEVAPRVRDRS